MRELISKKKDKEVYKEDGRTIKIFDSSYPTSRLLNEATNIALLEDYHVNVPELIEVGREEDGRWHIITRFVEGDTLAGEMDGHPEKEDEYLLEFVKLHLKIHSAKGPFLDRQRDALNRSIRNTDLNATTRYHLHTGLNAMPNNLYLCHGDYNPTNVIHAKDGEYYVIDWGHASAGNRAADAANTYINFLLAGQAERAEKYFKYYSELSGKDMDYLLKWVPYAAAGRYADCAESEKALLMSCIEESWK